MQGTKAKYARPAPFPPAAGGVPQPQPSAAAGAGPGKPFTGQQPPGYVQQGNYAAGARAGELVFLVPAWRLCLHHVLPRKRLTVVAAFPLKFHTGMIKMNQGKPGRSDV